MSNSNDQKSASTQAAETASDEKKVTSPQTDANAKVEPGEKPEPAKNAQSPAQSSR